MRRLVLVTFAVLLLPCAASANQELMSLQSDDGSTLIVRAGDPGSVQWLTKHYTAVIEESLAEVGRPGAVVHFVSEAHEVPAPSGPVPVQEVSRVETEEPADPGGLSPRYSFGTFIFGASNQFAHAACRAVAEAPSRSYNPLFIYGGVGLGKTHLMHAIGHYVMTHSPGLKLTYISAERFMNEVINAIRYDRILEFR